MFSLCHCGCPCVISTTHNIPFPRPLLVPNNQQHQQLFVPDTLCLSLHVTLIMSLSTPLCVLLSIPSHTTTPGKGWSLTSLVTGCCMQGTEKGLGWTTGRSCQVRLKLWNKGELAESEILKHPRQSWALGYLADCHISMQALCSEVQIPKCKTQGCVHWSKVRHLNLNSK